MATNYGGNSFPFTTAETSAERLPIWNYIDHSKLIGVAIVPDETWTVGTVFKIGTPVQLSTDGSKPKIGADATAPDGLLRTNAVMDGIGCTLSIVRAGSIRVNLLDVEITEAQEKALPNIDFDREYVIKKS